MKSVPYANLKKGELYAMYKKMSSRKLVVIFQLLDSQPVMDTFSIITVRHAWLSGIDNDHTKMIQYRDDYATDLSPDSENLFHLDYDEYQSHFVIPQL